MTSRAAGCSAAAASASKRQEGDGRSIETRGCTTGDGVFKRRHERRPDRRLADGEIDRRCQGGQAEKATTILELALIIVTLLRVLVSGAIMMNMRLSKSVIGLSQAVSFPRTIRQSERGGRREQANGIEGDQQGRRPTTQSFGQPNQHCALQ